MAAERGPRAGTRPCGGPRLLGTLLRTQPGADRALLDRFAAVVAAAAIAPRRFDTVLPFSPGGTGSPALRLAASGTTVAAVLSDDVRWSVRVYRLPE